MRNARALENEIRYRESHFKSANAVDDTIVYWFAVAALTVFLIAGILVYRDATSDHRVASNGARLLSVAATSARVEQPPMHAHVEGIDP